MWDYNHFGFRRGNYFPFNSTSDLIDQFNFIGYHDVCIYPSISDMAEYPSDNIVKGVKNVYPGHQVENQTGKELKLVAICTNKN